MVTDLNDGRTYTEIAYDELAETYDDGYDHPPALAENDVLRRWTRGLVRGPVVDVGCGTGLFVDLHNGRVGTYIGLDVSRGMLEHARRKHPHRPFVHHDFDEEWPIPRGWAQAVVSLFAFNYSLDPTSWINSMARSLAPMGRFFIVLCAPRWPERHTYASGDAPVPALYSAQDARDLFAGHPSLRDVRIRGMSRWVDRGRGRRRARALLELEVATALRVRPDRGYYLVVDGRRRESWSGPELAGSSWEGVGYG